MYNKSNEIKQALRVQFRNGTSKLTKRVCFGYDRDEHGDLVINQSEAQIVKWMFERYLSGYSLGKIADELCQKGIPSPTGKEKWNREAIDKLLSNEKYIGVVLLQKTLSVMGIQVENNGSAERYLTKKCSFCYHFNRAFSESAGRKDSKESRKCTGECGKRDAVCD